MKDVKKILLLNSTIILSLLTIQSHVLAAAEEEECETDWNSHTDAKRLNDDNEWNKDWSDVTVSFRTTGTVKDRHYTPSDFKATQTYYYDYKYEIREREKEECSGDVRYKPGSSWERDTSRGDNGWKHESDPVTGIDIKVKIEEDRRWGYHNEFWMPDDNAVNLGLQHEGYGDGKVIYSVKATGENDETDEMDSDVISYWIYKVDVKLNNPRDPDNPSPLFVDDGSSNPSQPYYSDERNEDDNPSWTCTKYYGGGKGSKSCSVQQENWAVGGGGSFGGRYENATSYLYSHTDHPNGHRAGQKHVLGILFFHIKDVAIIIPKKEVYADEFDPSKNKCFLIYHTVGEYQWSDGVDPTPAADYAGQVKPCTATQNVTGTLENRNNFFNNTNANKYKDYKYITYSKSHTGSRSGITKSDSGTQKIAYPRKVNVYDYRDNADSPNSKYSQTYVLYQRPKNGNEVRDAYGISCKRWWHRIKDNNGNLLGERTDACIDKDGTSGNSQTSALGSTASPRSGTSPYVLGRMYPHNGDGNHLNDVPLGNQSHSWKYGYVDQWNWTKDEHKVNYLGVREVIVKVPSEEASNKADEKIVERYVTNTHKNGFDRTPSTSNNHNNYLLGSTYASYQKESYSKPTCYVYFTSGLINAYVNQNGGSIGSGDLGFKSGDGVGDLTNGDASTRYIKRSCQSSLQINKNYDSNDETHSLVTGSRANNARPLHFLPSSNSFDEYNSSHKNNMTAKNNFKPGIRWSKWDLGEPYRLEDYYYMDNSYDSNASAIYIHSMVSDVNITYPAASEAQSIKLPYSYYSSVGAIENPTPNTQQHYRIYATKWKPWTRLPNEDLGKSWNYDTEIATDNEMRNYEIQDSWLHVIGRENGKLVLGKEHHSLLPFNQPPNVNSATGAWTNAGLVRNDATQGWSLNPDTRGDYRQGNYRPYKRKYSTKWIMTGGLSHNQLLDLGAYDNGIYGFAPRTDVADTAKDFKMADFNSTNNSFTFTNPYTGQKYNNLSLIDYLRYQYATYGNNNSPILPGYVAQDNYYFWRVGGMMVWGTEIEKDSSRVLRNDIVLDANTYGTAGKFYPPNTAISHNEPIWIEPINPPNNPAPTDPIVDKVWKKTYQDKPYGNYSCKYAYAPTIGKGGTESYGGGYVKVTDCLDKMFIQSDSGQKTNMDTAVNKYDNSRKISYNYVNNDYDDRYFEARVYANSTKLMFGTNHPKGDSGTVIPDGFEDEDITGSRTNYRCKVTWQDNVDWANNGQKEITYLENSLPTSDTNYSKIWYSTYLGERFDYIGIGWKNGYVDLSGTRHKPQNINQFYPVDPTGKTYYINCDYPHNTYDNKLTGKPSYVKDTYAPGKDKVKFDVLGIQKLEVFDYPSSAITNPESGLKAVDTNGNASDKTPFHFVKDGKGKTYETGHWYNFNAKVTFSEDNTGNQKVQWLNSSTHKEKNWRYGYKTSSPNVIPTSIDETKLYLGNCTTTYANNGSLECPYPSHITSRTSMKFTGHDHRLPYDSGDTNKWNTIRIDYFSEAPIPTGSPEIKSKTYEEVILWSHRPIDLIIEGKSVVDYGDTENYLMKKAWSDGKSQTNHQLNDPLDETNRYVGKNNNPYLTDAEEKSENINPTTPNQAIYWETDAKLTSQNNVNPATVKFSDFQGDNTKRTIYAYWGDKNRLQSGYDFWDYLYKEKIVTVNFDCSIEFKTVVQGCPIHDSLTVDGVETDNWRFPDALQLELNYIYTMPFQVTGVAKGSGN